jgi:hypothetical protein
MDALMVHPEKDIFMNRARMMVRDLGVTIAMTLKQENPKNDLYQNVRCF